MFFLDLLFEVSNHILSKQCEKVTPKGTQKETQNRATHGCPTPQNIWYLLYGSHIFQFWSCSGIHFVSLRISDTVFLSFFRLLKNEVPEWCPKWVIYGKICSNSTLSPKSPQETPRRAQDLSNDAKTLRKGPKIMLQDPQNCSFSTTTMFAGT